MKSCPITPISWKAAVRPVNDEQLFTFANEENWKDKLNPDTLKKVEALISDYETALQRIRYVCHTSTDRKRKNDIYRILFVRGQEQSYTVDELYTAFDHLLPHQIRKARLALTEQNWQFTPPEERANFLYSVFNTAGIYPYISLFSDFRSGGYRIIGDIICDLDDMYRNIGIRKNIANQKGDSPQLKKLLSGSVFDKEQIIRNCKSVIRPIDRREKENALEYAEVVKCAVALGKRQFALEVLPHTVLELTLDRSHIYTEKPKKRIFWK